MNRVTLPGLPDKRAADYDLGDGKFARVIYMPQESKPDRKMIEVQAFQIDAKGRFVSQPNGAPSRTPGTVHVISTTGVGDTHTLLPGWTRVVGDYNESNLPPNAKVMDALPNTANVNDQVYVDPTLYRWDEGMVESIMRGKAKELGDLLRNSMALADFEL